MQRYWILLIAVFLEPACSEQAPSSRTPRLPWNIEVGADGHTSVFGITLGTSNFSEAETELGDRYTLALFGPESGTPQLEAYYKQVIVGGLTGRMVLNISLPAADLRAMRDRSPRDRVQVQGSERRWKVADEDLALARRGVVSVIGYVPAVDLEPEVIELRFGAPTERVSMPDGSAHWSYPEQGLDIVINPEGRELLQYVIPADFDRLRAPLEHVGSG
jgi:hypothetical protein